jgi:KaiC/GvpD/RAD55 family RecA-like ATPase
MADLNLLPRYNHETALHIQRLILCNAFFGQTLSGSTGMGEAVKPQNEELPRVGTGVQGLDTILGGGLPRNRIYLLQGTPGTGKTTLAQQFLLEGVRQGEKTLYVALSETKDELAAVANSHGWSLEGIHLYELEGMEDLLKPEDQYTVFHPAEVELGQTTKRICEQVQAIEPARLVLDSLSEMRLIAQNPLRYRRQILSLKQFFQGRQCTVLLLDDGSGGKDDLQLESIAHVGKCGQASRKTGCVGQRRCRTGFAYRWRTGLRLERFNFGPVRLRQIHHCHPVRIGGAQARRAGVLLPVRGQHRNFSLQGRHPRHGPEWLFQRRPDRNSQD